MDSFHETLDHWTEASQNFADAERIVSELQQQLARLSLAPIGSLSHPKMLDSLARILAIVKANRMSQTHWKSFAQHGVQSNLTDLLLNAFAVRRKIQNSPLIVEILSVSTKLRDIMKSCEASSSSED